jgi:hypothetical protein
MDGSLVGTVVAQTKVPSYVTAACSFEFIFLSVQNKKKTAFQKQVTCVTCTEFSMAVHVAVNSYVSQCFAPILRDKYRNLFWGPLL